MNKAMEEFLNSAEFYDLMQTYRHMPPHLQADVIKAYEAVKDAVLARASKQQEQT